MCSPRRPSVVRSTDPWSFYPGIISIINSLGRRIIMTERIEITNITIPWRILPAVTMSRGLLNTLRKCYLVKKYSNLNPLGPDIYWQLFGFMANWFQAILQPWGSAQCSNCPANSLSNTAWAGVHSEHILEILCNENLLGQIPKSTVTQWTNKMCGEGTTLVTNSAWWLWPPDLCSHQ